MSAVKQSDNNFLNPINRLSDTCESPSKSPKVTRAPRNKHDNMFLFLKFKKYRTCFFKSISRRFRQSWVI